MQANDISVDEQNGCMDAMSQRAHFGAAFGTYDKSCHTNNQLGNPKRQLIVPCFLLYCNNCADYNVLMNEILLQFSY